MYKRILTLMLVLLVTVAGFSALAEAVPSVTLDAIVTISNASSAAGTALPDTFAVEVVPQSEAASNVIEEIAAAAQTAPVADYFGETVMATAAEKLPTGVDTSALKLDELTTVMVYGYEESYGDIVLTLAPAAEYADDDVIVVLVGVVIDGVLTWIPMDAAIVDGQICVTFTQDILSAGNSELLFALLRAE